MYLEKDEYIVAIDTSDDESSEGMSSVTFNTSHWSGRNVCFGIMSYSSNEDMWEDGGEQFPSGKKFHVKNGSMITSMNISEGQITSIIKEEVPKNGKCNWEDDWRN